MSIPIPFPEPQSRIIGHLRTDTDPQMPALPRGSKKRLLPRLFQITYDSRRLRLKEVHTLWGTQYPNGCITLENGVVFGDGLSELEEHFKRAGNFEVRWVQVMEVAEEEA